MSIGLEFSFALFPLCVSHTVVFFNVFLLSLCLRRHLFHECSLCFVYVSVSAGLACFVFHSVASGKWFRLCEPMPKRRASPSSCIRSRWRSSSSLLRPGPESLASPLTSCFALRSHPLDTTRSCRTLSQIWLPPFPFAWNVINWHKEVFHVCRFGYFRCSFFFQQVCLLLDVSTILWHWRSFFFSL